MIVNDFLRACLLIYVFGCHFEPIALLTNYLYFYACVFSFLRIMHHHLNQI